MKWLVRIKQLSFIVGIILMVLAVSDFIAEQRFHRVALESKAEIVDLQAGMAHLRFKDADKREHFAEIPRRKINADTQESGKYIAVQYLPNAPVESLRVMSTRPYWLSVLIRLVVALLVLALAFYLRRKIAEIIWKRNRIFQGKKIVTNVDHIDEVKGDDGQPRWVITTSWIDQRTLQTRTFRSPKLKLDEATLDDIRHVRVWLHPDDPNVFKMDLKGIAKRDKQHRHAGE